MTCPNCSNYFVFEAIGGICWKRCSSCAMGEKKVTVPELTIHAARGAQAASSTSSEDRQRLASRLSYDTNLLQLDDVLCAKCKTPVRVWMQKDYRYMYICPKCREEVDVIDKR